jgi:hypothetical protein
MSAPNDGLDLVLLRAVLAQVTRAHAEATRLNGYTDGRWGTASFNGCAISQDAIESQIAELDRLLRPKVVLPDLRRPVCDHYHAIAGTFGGPCVTCGQSQPDHVASPARTPNDDDWAILFGTLGPDGIVEAPPLQRIAAFLRLYARRIRANEHWDVPETMARAYESAARLIDAEEAITGPVLAALRAEAARRDAPASGS